jgi:hypothetical protein
LCVCCAVQMKTYFRIKSFLELHKLTRNPSSNNNHYINCSTVFIHQEYLL